MIDKHRFYERIAICLESHMSQRVAEAVAAREFFASCNLLTAEDKADADRLGWSKLKMFRTMNREGLKEWNPSIWCGEKAQEIYPMNTQQ